MARVSLSSPVKGIPSPPTKGGRANRSVTTNKSPFKPQRPAVSCPKIIIRNKVKEPGEVLSRFWTISRHFMTFFMVISMVLPAILIWVMTETIMRPMWYRFPGANSTIRSLPSDQVFPETPKTPFDLDYEDISFSAEDGSTLRGWLIKPPFASSREESGIILIHGAGTSRLELLRCVYLYSLSFFSFRDLFDRVSVLLLFLFFLLTKVFCGWRQPRSTFH